MAEAFPPSGEDDPTTTDPEVQALMHSGHDRLILPYEFPERPVAVHRFRAFCAHDTGYQEAQTDSGRAVQRPYIGFKYIRREMARNEPHLRQILSAGDVTSNIDYFHTRYEPLPPSSWTRYEMRNDFLRSNVGVAKSFMGQVKEIRAAKFLAEQFHRQHDYEFTEGFIVLMAAYGVTLRNRNRA